MLALTTAAQSEPCSRLRVYQHAAALEADGTTLTVAPFMNEALYHRKNRRGATATIVKATLLLLCVIRRLAMVLVMHRYDILLVQKEAFPWGGPWIERLAKRRGLGLVFDIDDGVFLQHAMSGGWRRIWWDADRVPTLMSMSDLVVVGSAALAEYAREHSANVVVLGTSVPDRYFGIAANTDLSDTVRLGWIGTQTNLHYLLDLSDVFRRVYAMCPFELWVVGGPNVADLAIEGVPVVTRLWSEHSERECLDRIDIGLMPLPDDEWTRFKCGYKLIQYMAAGKVGVASPVGENQNLVVHGVTGMLCGGEDEWVDSLVELIRDTGLRSRIGAAGRASVERFRASAVGRELAHAISGAVQ